MSRVIAGLYEIERELGSGGGGVVFLAKHQRLGKHVVLKGDKRSLTSKQSALRREVDSLKNLSHSYIPQVYDYVSDRETVYTVMDFVDGESLDKLLANNARFEQPRILAWARQLLEAVAYLHQQPPHGILHADIKPSNIMLTPQDEIRLIDFNIALHLGEDGAVAVGQSFGYASPEHYGIDYSTGATTDVPENTDDGIKPLTESDVRTVVDDLDVASPSKPTYSGKKKLIDVRSDIYGIGATLYHLLTGVRPKREATEVEPILRQHCSGALAAIIEKAMAPNPDLRYQSAEEMLSDILNIRKNDPRVKRWKRIRTIACAAITFAVVVGGLSAFAGMSLAEQEQRAQAEAGRIEAEEHRAALVDRLIEVGILRAEMENQRADAEELRRNARMQEMLVLAAKSADALLSGDRFGAITLALDAVPNENDVGIPHSPEAVKALTDALGVYDLSDGFKPHRTVTVPSEIIDITIAPDGSSFAAMSLGKLSVFETWSGDLLAELPAIESGLADIRYIGRSTIVFAGVDGLTVYDITSRAVRWVGDFATTISVSADGKTIAAVNRDEYNAKIYNIDGTEKGDAQFGARGMWTPVNDRFGNPGGRVFELNYDGSLLAVSFSNGGLEIFDLYNSQRNIELFDESEYTYFEGGFHGKYFAFSASNEKESLFAVIDTERLIQTISTMLTSRIGVFADENGIFWSVNNINESIDPETAMQTPVRFDPRDHIAGGYRVEGGLNSPIVRITRFLSCEDKEIFSYDRNYTHDEARLNAGDNRIILFSYRQFRILDFNGGLVNETIVPNAGQVYDQQYRRDNGESLLEVVYYDGTVNHYSSNDGTLTIAESIPPPDTSLDEEFTTDNLLITAPLHGTPCVYDLATGEFICELEKDAYLVYVTQVGNRIITEYISDDGNRYGLLIDGQTGETLAFIPNLCDIIGERLIIDICSSGSLRETRLYSIDEMIEMAREEIRNGR